MTTRPKLWILTIMFTTPGAMVKLVYDDEISAKAVKNQLDEALETCTRSQNSGDLLGGDSAQKVRDAYGANLTLRMRDVMALNLSDLEAEFQGAIEFGLRQDEANAKAQARMQGHPSIVKPFPGFPPRN